MRSVRNPITLSATPADYRLPPPGLGEHDAEIRAWLAAPNPVQPRLRGRCIHRGVGRTAGVSGDERAYGTALGTSDADHINLLGLDLAEDLMGQVGFGELAFWLVTLRRPTPGEVRVFESVLVALADHGFTPTAIAARLTYLSAPDSLQGALAAGLLGGVRASSASPRTAAPTCTT